MILLAVRSRKINFARMQKHSGSLNVFIFFESIFFISDDRMSDGMKMHPDLMRPAGLGKKLRAGNNRPILSGLCNKSTNIFLFSHLSSREPRLACENLFLIFPFLPQSFPAFLSDGQETSARYFFSISRFLKRFLRYSKDFWFRATTMTPEVSLSKR